MRPMLTREYAHAGHVDRFTVTRSHVGWDVREERDNHIVRQVNYQDWHRVERAMQAFELARRAAGSMSSN
jgi:hypothetical protein